MVVVRAAVGFVALVSAALVVFFGSALGLFVSLLSCRAENTTPPGACAPVDNHPELVFLLGAVAPAMLVLLAGRQRRALVVVIGVQAWGWWIAYLIALSW
jgi:hypothetical protein